MVRSRSSGAASSDAGRSRARWPRRTRAAGRPRPAPRALAAFAAAGCALTGAAVIALAVAAGPTPGLTGYVSEAGIATSGNAGVYRAGVFGLAAALLLLAAALPGPPRLAARLAAGEAERSPRSGSRTPTWRVPARAGTVLLVAAAGGTVVSGAVTCTNGCPLPPFEAATAADLVHGGASIAAVACCVFAMLAMAGSPALDGLVRRLAVAGLAGALPLSGVVGVAMLTLGRGTVVGLLERLLLGLIVIWVAATAVRLGVSWLRVASADPA